MKVRANLAVVGSGQYGLSSPFDCSIWAIRGSSGVVLIDAGCGAATQKILSNVREDFAAPVTGVIATHSHADHARGLRSLRDMTDCVVYVPDCSRTAIETGDEEATGLRAARAAGVYPADFPPLPSAVDGTLSDGVEISVCGLQFLPLHVRGHSRDHFCLLHVADGETWLFSGDAVFYGGVLGLINADGSDMAGYRSDFHKLAKCEIDGLFPGHGMFTRENGSRHIRAAADTLNKGSLGRQIGQWDIIF